MTAAPDASGQAARAPAPGPVRRVMISCGEASGDMYAGALVRAIRALDPGVDVFGFGGDQMRTAGAELVGDYRGFSVTGLIEAISVLPRSWAMLRRLREAAAARRPDVFVAIDFPDFNFQLLPAMRRLGVKIVYYVSPQLWAWRPGRLETIRRNVDRMLVIFPFEQAIYERAGVPVEFVGHPLLDLTRPATPRAEFLRAVGLDPDRPVLALLPGSRPNELRYVLPALAGAAPIIAASVPGVQFLVARAPSLDDGLFAPLEAVRQRGLPVAIATQATDDVLDAADAVVTASGTATVQSALHGTPMVIVYRLSPLTYAIGRRFVRVQTYGMVNLVAGRRVVPELIQDALTPEAVAREVVPLLTDRARADAMRRDLADVRARLGGPGASRRAAEVTLHP
ncbi:MAG TPA: lipid-A-disaccharide synthase [Vicinamibacterales bacterium]|nr:lipid-A-disaccharide synthase [Vicinamibacterales bacterium]